MKQAAEKEAENPSDDHVSRTWLEDRGHSVHI